MMVRFLGGPLQGEMREFKNPDRVYEVLFYEPATYNYGEEPKFAGVVRRGIHLLEKHKEHGFFYVYHGLRN